MFVLLVLTAFVAVVVQCSQLEKKKDPRGTAYAGSTACVSCHRDIAHSFAHNAHFNTSRLLETAASIDSLHLPEGQFIFNEHTKVGIERRGDGLYQIAYVNGKEVKAERIDVSFGSGKVAYTFAFWYDHKLVQMPLNYHTGEQQWVNSPGYPSDQIYFGRYIIARCLECHGSFADKRLVKTEQFTVEEEFDKASLIAGIDCERCHGPAAQHVAFHEENPKEKQPKYIASYQALSVNRKMDMCGICHSGIEFQSLDPIFYFKPGDTLRSLPQFSDYMGEDPDVHGKQVQLLKASKCYKIGKLDCTSCHDIHQDKKSSLQAYTQQCISCHQDFNSLHTNLSPKNKASLADNCIDCHMPIKESRDIGFQKSGTKEKIPYWQHTHRIAVYRELVGN